MTSQYQSRVTAVFAPEKRNPTRCRAAIATAFTLIGLLVGGYAGPSIAQSIFPPGSCRQDGGPLTCVAATPGLYYTPSPFGGLIRGDTASGVFTTLLELTNVWEDTVRPRQPGTPPIIWVPDPSRPPCPAYLPTAWFSGTQDKGGAIRATMQGSCWMMPTLGGTQWAAAGPVTINLEIICPSQWSFYGSFAPGYISRPGSCSSPVGVSPKNISNEECTGCAKSRFGNPIEASVFNKSQIETDYVANGAPLSLQIQRVYNSFGGIQKINIGKVWRISYDRHIELDASGFVGAHRHTGGYYGFKLVSGNYVSDTDVNMKLTKIVDGNGALQGWALRSSADEIETYNAAGLLVSINDRSGATLTLNYDGAGRLSVVVDPFGRELQFTYDTIGRVSRISTPGGDYVYGYNGANPNLTDNLISVTGPDQKIRSYVYAELANTQNVRHHHALTGIVDENGVRYATFFYDTTGRAISTEYAGGVNKYVLSGGGNNTSVISPLGTTLVRTFTIASDSTKRVSAETQPCSTPGCTGNVATALTYDANFNVSSRTDFKGNKTCYGYDLARNLELTRVEGLASAVSCSTALVASTFTAPARKFTTTWHPTFRLPATVTEPVTGGSRVTTNTYDGSGNLTQRQVTTPAGTRTSSWTYDALGRVLTATDPLGRTSVNTFYPNTPAQNLTLANSRGMLASSANARGQTVNITSYNPHGQPLSMTDANGLTTSMAYDARQRMISRTVGAETTAYDYDGVGQLVKVTLPDNSFLTYTYDGAHRLVQVQDGLGNKMVYTLDNMGNRIAESAVDTLGALARTRSRVYDALNRLQRDIGGAGFANPAAAQVSQYAYDNNGNQTTMTDPLARVTTNAYDALNRLIQVTDPNAPVGLTKYEYDAQDNLTKVTDPKNLATTYSYNGFNELVAQVSPDTGATSFTYDAAGNMLTKTDARNVTVTYSYDSLNRVSSIGYPAVGTVPAQTVTYGYDSCSNGIGRLCNFTDRTGTTTYRYDLNGRVTGKTQNISGLNQSVAYRYNAVGQMDEMTMPSGKKVAVSYLNNRITGLSVDGQPIVKTADYEPFGPIGEWTWGNDSVSSPNKHTRYFDLDGRNTKIESGAVGNSAIDPAIIVYDAASRITALQRLTANVVDPAKSTSYGYDNLDRLTTVTPNAGNPTNPQGYTYDAIGNRLSNTIAGSTTTYSYGATSHRLNSLAGATATTFGYDSVGNRITDGIQTWIYGGDNRPSAISLAGANPVSIQSGINALGQRVLKTVNSAAQGAITRFVYDEAGRLIGEYDISGRPIQETIWLNDLPVAVLK